MLIAIRCFAYLFGAVPYVDENTGVKEIPVQYTRKQIFEFAESELLAIENELKVPGSNEYGRVDRVAGWFLLARMYLNAQTWINENKYQEAYIYATKVIADGHYPLASDYREIFLADNNTCKEIILAVGTGWSARTEFCRNELLCEGFCEWSYG